MFAALYFVQLPKNFCVRNVVQQPYWNVLFFIGWTRTKTVWLIQISVEMQIYVKIREKREQLLFRVQICP